MKKMVSPGGFLTLAGPRITWRAWEKQIAGSPSPEFLIHRVLGGGDMRTHPENEGKGPPEALEQGADGLTWTGRASRA